MFANIKPEFTYFIHWFWRLRQWILTCVLAIYKEKLNDHTASNIGSPLVGIAKVLLKDQLVLFHCTNYLSSFVYQQD